MLSRIAAFVSLAMLASPAAALPPNEMMIRICTGAGLRMMAMPVNDRDSTPADCKKACHAVCERRKKSGKRSSAG